MELEHHRPTMENEHITVSSNSYEEVKTSVSICHWTQIIL